MTTLTVHCDRCATRILESRTLLRIDCGPFRGRWADGVDLCPECVEWFAASLQPKSRETVS
jgi:hypothetical protein